MYFKPKEQIGLYDSAFEKDSCGVGFVANIAVMITLVLSVQFKPSSITGSALEVHNAISTLAYYSPAFVIGSLTAYLVSQTFDVWFFNKLKEITGELELDKDKEVV